MKELRVGQIAWTWRYTNICKILKLTEEKAFVTFSDYVTSLGFPAGLWISRKDLEYIPDFFSWNSFFKIRFNNFFLQEFSSCCNASRITRKPVFTREGNN